MHRIAALCLIVAACACPGAARAADPSAPASPLAAPRAETVGVRTGDHAGFGRVVFDLPHGVDYAVTREGDRIRVRFTGGGGAAVAVGAVPRLPQNVQAIVVGQDSAELAFTETSALTIGRSDDKLVIDAAASATPAVPAAVPITVARPPDARERDIAAAPPPPPPPSAVPPPTAASLPVAPAPVSAAPAADAATPPVRLAATPAAPPPTAAAPLAGPGGGRAVTLPFSPGTGAAAFRRGDGALVIFDERRPIDMAALQRDPVFANASITLLAEATMLRLVLPPRRVLRLTPGATGWTVTVLDRDAAAALRPIRPTNEGGRLRLPAERPGHVVSVPDPVSGDALLVGTLAPAGPASATVAPDQGLPVERRTPDFRLLSTWLGVAVVPQSDAVALHPAADGFVLAAEGERPLTVAVADAQAEAAAGAAGATRRYDLPALPLEALRQRMQGANTAAAIAPPQARTQPRRRLAEALVALGMGAEAQAVLALAVAEDPHAAGDPDIVGLAAIAALLAGRDGAADGIDDPHPTGSDEISLWRAVREAHRQPDSPGAAQQFAATFNLLLAYPEPLQRRLLPLAAETMARGGETAAAQRLCEARQDDRALDLARGYVAQRTGTDPQAALAIYDRLTQEGDRRVRAQAAIQAVELRLTAGLLSKAAAADALDRLLFAWRDETHELALRLRIADLRAQARDFRPALTLLRQTRQIFPRQDGIVRERLASVFAQALAADAEQPLPPLDFVALAEENADLVPPGEAGQPLAARLADRLIALDLPDRAVPALERLAAGVAPGPARAEFGGKLAAMRLQQGDANGALATLAATVVVGPLPPELLERRTLVFARASAATGDLAHAAAALAALDSAAADALRATLLEQAKEWKGAVAALRAYAARTVPAQGPLDAAQAETVLRLAAAAAEAADDATLAQLREQDEPRLPEGRAAEIFRVITALPVQAATDLPRAAQEARLARSMPDALKGLTTTP